MKRSSLITAAAFIGTGIALSVPLLAFADDSFVPLTQLPGISSISSLTATSMTLPGFINTLYRIAIGLAAFFAVVQIAWAGYLFMSSADSISKNTKARQKIMNAVIGLLLVLSPFIVFSVINPNILNISLNFADLKSPTTNTGSATNPGNQSGDGSGPATPQSCTATGFTNIKAVSDPPGCIQLGGNYTNIVAGCCAGMPSTGAVCCGDASNL